MPIAGAGVLYHASTARARFVSSPFRARPLFSGADPTRADRTARLIARNPPAAKLPHAAYMDPKEKRFCCYFHSRKTLRTLVRRTRFELVTSGLEAPRHRQSR